jgi:hypothetical protein
MRDGDYATATTIGSAAWLAELFAGAEGRLALCPGRFAADWYDLGDSDAIDRAVCGQANVYFHVALHDPTLDPDAKRGRNSTATSIAFLWDDGDVHGPAHPRNDLPESVGELVEFYEALLPGPPSCLVYSGHGVYPFWRLSEPLGLRDDERRQVARRLLAAYRSRRDGEAEARGWRLDEVGGFARVLRVPGSINAKPGLPRVPVKLARWRPELRYHAEDLLDLLPPVPPEELEASIPPPATAPAKPGRFPPAQFDPIPKVCAFARYCIDNAADLDYDRWWTFLRLVTHCEDGERLAYELSAPYLGFKPREATYRIAQAVKSKPPRCRTIRRDHPGHCDGCICPSLAINSPIAIGMLQERG